MKLTLPYPPSANRYWRVGKQGHVHKSDEARGYQSLVQALARTQSRVRPLEGRVSVQLWVYRPAKRGDLDNSLKVLLDALKGVAYLDDKQVKRIVAEQHDDKARPRVEVCVEALEQPMEAA